MTDDLGLPPISPEEDRFMLCGSTAMLDDLSGLLDERGFIVSPGIGEPGDYVIERAFVSK
jgi:ferredoxin--NADP+ reductase